MRGNNQLRQECSEGSFGGVNLALTMPRAAQASITPSCYPALPGPVAAPEQLPGALCCKGRSATASGAPRPLPGALLWIHSPSPHFSAAAARGAPKQPQDAEAWQTKDWGNSTTPLSNKNRRVDALAPAENNNQAAD